MARGAAARRSGFGADRFVQKLRLEDGIDLPVDRLLAIVLRELAATQEEFRKVAAGLNGDWNAAWREVQSGHPAAGELLAVARRQVGELATFVERKRIVSLPAHEPLVVAPTPEFYRWTFASLSTAGPFEAKALPAYYYITNIDPAWPAETAGAAPPGLQRGDAVVDLDPRDLSGPLPPVRASPAERRAAAPQVDPVCTPRRSLRVGRTTANR